MKKYKFSILGDSISSYDGYTNNQSYNSALPYNITYYKSTMDKSDLESVNDTYWMISANALGLEICVPNACAASRVSDTVKQSYPDTFIPSGPERANALHRDGKDEMYPDVIFVFLGTNDIGNGIDLELFEKSYRKLIVSIKENYKSASLYVATILPMHHNKPYTQQMLDAYNESIRNTARTFSAGIVDFAVECGVTMENYQNTTADGLHPNRLGMKKLADCLTRTLKKDLT
jgi:lysophospholipase L1-like esterase